MVLVENAFCYSAFLNLKNSCLLFSYSFGKSWSPISGNAILSRFR